MDNVRDHTKKRRIAGRSENFLRDGAQYRVAHRGKGSFCFATASFNAISKNAGIGDRSGDLVARSREKSEYCKYSILEARRSAVIKESSMSAFEWSDIRRDGCEFADCVL